MNRRQLIIGVCVILAWTASTSSAVMGQDAHSQHGIHSAGATERLFQAKMSVLGEIKPGEAFTIDIHIQDDKGQNVDDFDIFQEKLMHLILVSDDLAFFSHLHPVHQGSGHFQTTVILPSAGTYTLFSDYKPAGDREQVSVLKLRMKGTEKSSGIMDMKVTEKVVQDTLVRMSFSPKTVKANEDAIITFDLKQLDGKPSFYHETLRDVLIKAINMKAKWMGKKIKEEVPGVEVIADMPEPTLVTFTSAGGTGTVPARKSPARPGPRPSGTPGRRSSRSSGPPCS